ncbi:hypothetical protein DV702_08695 [Sporosarcina sp. PTS2304]|uniref:hypothetical protein n=1 Tax=Sporosarcina sp. PTS2304 TaxID=2283194 RepID=UPI000E0D2797|nr:hypothetical protein [Sporosarcina sp. PTS2304]AXH99804.1 hypothetical protein DV702_08695 [Sporosarcina sp. PTS2304]
MITEIVGPWTITTDPQRTKKFYDNHHYLSQDCNCEYCVNYLLACEQFPPTIYRLFESLGIDPRKEGEVSEFGKSAEGLYHYIVFYHFVGEIVKEPSSALASPDFHVEGFSVSFTNDLDLLPDDFPMPAVQIMLEMQLPWLLGL